MSGKGKCFLLWTQKISGECYVPGPKRVAAEFGVGEVAASDARDKYGPRIFDVVWWAGDPKGGSSEAKLEADWWTRENVFTLSPHTV